MRRRRGTILVCAALAAAPILYIELDRFDEKVARDEFLLEHPGERVLELFVGEGDGSCAYVHIRHCRPGELQREDVWQYLRDASGRWSLAYRETLPESGLLCER